MNIQVDWSRGPLNRLLGVIRNGSIGNEKSVSLVPPRIHRWKSARLRIRLQNHAPNPISFSTFCLLSSPRPMLAGVRKRSKNGRTTEFCVLLLFLAISRVALHYRTNHLQACHALSNCMCLNGSSLQAVLQGTNSWCSIVHMNHPAGWQCTWYRCMMFCKRITPEFVYLHPFIMDYLRNVVMQHTRTPFPTILGSNSMWTFRWIGREGR